MNHIKVFLKHNHGIYKFNPRDQYIFKIAYLMESDSFHYSKNQKQINSKNSTTISSLFNMFNIKLTQETKRLVLCFHELITLIKDNTNIKDEDKIRQLIWNPPKITYKGYEIPESLYNFLFRIYLGNFTESDTVSGGDQIYYLHKYLGLTQRVIQNKRQRVVNCINGIHDKLGIPRIVPFQFIGISRIFIMEWINTIKNNY